MIRKLVFPRSYFQRLLSMLVNSNGKPVYCQLGISEQKEEVQYLVRSIEDIDSGKKLSGRYIQVSTTTRFLTLSDWISNISATNVTGHLIFGRESCEGHWWASVTDSSGDLLPIQQILLVGHEMPILKMSPFSNPDKEAESSSPIPPSIFNQWSRTIGVLGQQTWRRLTSLTIAIIGCGRSGSVAAVTLAKLGVKNLILIDPDKVETHNIPEMDGVNESDIGKFKVDVLASFLNTYCSSQLLPLNLKTYNQQITTSYRDVLPADILICYADNDAARLACGILVTLYHKVLLDIGTGILAGDNEEKGEKKRPIGADIRLIIPAQGCLRCFGNLAHYDEAVNELTRPSSSPKEPWWVNRLGSLRTLNMIAVHLGIQLLFDCISGELQQTTWVQLEYEKGGEIRIHQQKYQNTKNSCPLCLKGGMGDDGLCW